MMQQIANFIVDHDPMMVIRRTHDTVRYIRWAWNKDHAHPIDEEELRLFLCDEHYGDLTDEQRDFARQGRESAEYSACFVVRGFQRGLPLGTRLCSQSVVCYTLCLRCRENAIAAG